MYKYLLILSIASILGAGELKTIVLPSEAMMNRANMAPPMSQQRSTSYQRALNHKPKLPKSLHLKLKQASKLIKEIPNKKLSDYYHLNTKNLLQAKASGNRAYIHYYELIMELISSEQKRRKKFGLEIE
jgi:hypothetical protein